ncbi:hypothetical protein RHMOL_Rhmol01G0238800 [Rhododendron molle]|uniref:Uncharacterized protein n=1 Tax=Rhododendron molle TaxID=49168 RepID=A0ACC0Q678_RHOML|nr:hypothetical protein RHMOL_Rhmol01G0238800 [Rhododendron molle]
MISHRSGIPWNIIFPFVCWNIWNLRNKTLFQPTGTPIRDAILTTCPIQSTPSYRMEFYCYP